jgi:hypothetical protein
MVKIEVVGDDEKYNSHSPLQIEYEQEKPKGKKKR